MFQFSKNKAESFQTNLGHIYILLPILTTIFCLLAKSKVKIQIMENYMINLNLYGIFIGLQSTGTYIFNLIYNLKSKIPIPSSSIITYIMTRMSAPNNPIL